MRIKHFLIAGILVLLLLSGCTGPKEEPPVQAKAQTTNPAAPMEVQVTNTFETPKGLPEMQVINMTVDSMGWWPDTFVLQKGVKVKWVINVWDLTKCTNEIIVRDYGLDIKLKKGENIVEFTPDKKGTIRWSCWMHMVNGSFIVVDDPMNMSEIDNAMLNKN